MKNLESKQMPFRTIDQFYQPTYKQKNAQGIKVFPERRTEIKEGPLTPKGQLPSVLTYLTNLNQAGHLPRRIGNKCDYYPLIKKCRRRKNMSEIKQQLKRQNPEQANINQKNRFQTFVSSHPSNRSLLVFSHINKEQRKIDGEKKKFRQTRSLRKEEKEKEMRFSFYNTIEKSEHFLKKFKEDTFLQERGTNTYQNMFRRTITVQNILSILHKSKEKQRLGL